MPAGGPLPSRMLDAFLPTLQPIWSLEVEGVNVREGEGNIKISEGGDEIDKTAAGTAAAQLASPEGGAPAAVQSAVVSAEQPVAPVKKGVGRKPRGKKGKKVWIAAATELQRVDKERKAEVQVQMVFQKSPMPLPFHLWVSHL